MKLSRRIWKQWRSNWILSLFQLTHVFNHSYGYPPLCFRHVKNPFIHTFSTPDISTHTRKKVGCKNYCGLCDTWCSEYWYIPPGKYPHSSTLMKWNADFNPKRVVQCSNNCWSFGYLPKHRLFAGASAYCRSLGKCRILQISTDSASAEASAG